MDLKMNKRGVSPLIATVLLIAFAVSLGAVVINLGVNLFGDPCKERVIDVLEIEGNLHICHVQNTQSLSITLVNSGSKSVDGFKLTIIGETAYNDDFLEKLDPLEKNVISYPIANIKKVDVVSIIPLYEKQGQLKYCPQNQRDYTNIHIC